jgi:hypothetical protein
LHRLQFGNFTVHLVKFVLLNIGNVLAAMAQLVDPNRQ